MYTSNLKLVSNNNYFRKLTFYLFKTNRTKYISYYRQLLYNFKIVNFVSYTNLLYTFHIRSPCKYSFMIGSGP